MKQTVIITGHEEKGLIRKRTVYKGVVKGSPGLSGMSENKKFMKTYHHGDEVIANVTIYTKAEDEFMTFEILE